MSMPSVDEMILDYSHIEKVKNGTKKVLIKTENVKVGEKKVKIGTKKVFLGKEKFATGSHEESDSHWYNPFSWGRKKTVIDYEWRDKFELQDVFQTQDVYETRNVYEDQDIIVDKEVVNLVAIRKNVAKTVRDFAQTNINNFRTNATTNVIQAKDTLLSLMNVIDQKVKDVTRQLEEASKSKAEKERLIEENRKKVEWYESFKRKINGVLAI